MSREWLDYAWTNGPANSANERIVFLCLADHANFLGQSFPSVERISILTRLSRSTVFRILMSLKNDGWLTIEKGVGRGNLSTYQLLKKVSGGDLLEREKVSNEPIKGVKRASLYGLTKDLTKNKNKSVNDASAKPQIINSPKLRPPDPLVNSEIRNLVDLTVCASPDGVKRKLSTFDVTPADRVAVLDAAKAETHNHGIDLATALQGILQAVETQVAELPPGELRYLGNVGTYFKKRRYREDAVHLNGGGSNGNFKSKSERVTDIYREFLEQPAGNQESPSPNGDSQGQRRSRPIGSHLPSRRLM